MRGALALIAGTLTACASSPYLDVNEAVNSSMAFQTDAKQYGVADKWVTTCPAKGDCEDFAFCKARKLLEKGVPASSMAVVIGKTITGLDHAVLEVDGEVLDIPSGARLSHRYYGCGIDGRVWVYPGGHPTEVDGAGFTKCERAIATLH